PQLHNLRRVSDRVARIDRAEPAQLTEAWRYAEHRHPLGACAALIVLAPAILHRKPHPHAGCVPAGGTERPEQRLRSGGFVEMKRLRVETLRERFDLFGHEGVAADLGKVADAHVLEEAHQPTPDTLAASRRANIGLTVRVINTTPEEPRSWNRNLT